MGRILPSNHAFGIIPVSKTILNNDSYRGKNKFYVDLIYSFNILSLAGALPLLSVFIHLFISAEVIF